jgi:hypothetical protein
MKVQRHAPSAPAQAAPASWRARWSRFWFSPVDPVGLNALRVLAGLAFLVWLLPFAGHLDEFFGLNGWFDRQGYAEAARVIEDAPQQVGWSFLFVCGDSARLLRVAYWLSVAVLAAFTLGLAPRITALLSWTVVVSFSANPALEYEGDVLLALVAFYLALGFLVGAGRRPGQSWLSWLLAPGWPLSRLTRSGNQPAQPSLGANLALRLLQVHFAVVVVASCLHKLQFGDWWAGVALWYPLVSPLQMTAAEARAMAGNGESFLFALSAAGYAVLGWQLAFPLFAWRPGWRWLLLGGAFVGWLGTALVYDLPVVGPALVLSCLAYLSPAEWQRWLGRLRRAGQVLRRGVSRPAEKPQPAAVAVGQPQ